MSTAIDRAIAAELSYKIERAYKSGVDLPRLSSTLLLRRIGLSLGREHKLNYHSHLRATSTPRRIESLPNRVSFAHTGIYILSIRVLIADLPISLTIFTDSFSCIGRYIRPPHMGS
jgi:hypothetical protein